ncbi:MAG: ROK family protein [Clostridia bacterium]|nr:ROK family protein [Clostridia bacterium]
MNYRIGVDLGGTKICAGLVDESYNIIDKKQIKTGAERDSDLILADLADLCRDLCAANGIDLSVIDGIGIAIPGAVVPETGVVVYSCNLPTFKFLAVTEELKKLTGVSRIEIANDANAAALGEAVAGAAKGTRSSVMITLGTGVGGGVILDGKILTGINGAAAELGHTVVKTDGELCSCGRKGCFEVYSSATALKRMTREAITRAISLRIDTEMINAVNGDPDNADTRVAFDCAKKGDAEAKKVVDEYIKNLACGLTNMINTFQPEVLSIGGGICGEGDYLLKPLLPIIEHEQYTRDFGVRTQIKIAELGNEAGIIGAAALV